MAERDIVASFSGQIFEAAATKKWKSIISGPATVQVVNLDEQGHQIIALDKDREVLVHDIDTEMQLRSKDNFVQWRKINSAGKQVNYGLRLKSANDSQHFEAMVGGVLAMLETIPSATPTKISATSRAPTPGKPAPHKPPTTTTTPAQAEKEVKERDMLLKVHLPGKQTTVISVPSNITMEELLSNIVTKRHLDPRYHELVLPPSKPKTAQTQFSPSTQLHTLGITEIHVVKRTKPLADKKQQAPGLPPEQKKSVPSMEPRGSILPTEQNKTALPIDQKITTQPSTQTQKQAPMTILKVQLPYDQRTVIQVSPSMTMPRLLVYICEKRNLNPAHHTLTLPSPSSGQMRTVTREMTVSAITSGVITLIDLKAHQPSASSSAMPEAKFSGKKGSFSPNETKPVDKAQKRSAPPPPANEGKRRISQDLVHSLERKVVDRSGDKEGKQTAPQNVTPAGDKGMDPSPKNVAKRRAPPPPKIKKEAVDETDFGPEASVSPGTPKQLTTSIKQPIPGSPAKRPAPGIPTATKQQAGQQPPPPSPGRDTTNQTTTKKRRPAPTRPPPQRKLENELQQETPMNTTAPNQDVMDIKKTTQQGRPISASSAQYKHEVDELEESLFDVVEEAERHLQEEVFKEDTDTKQESSVDETNSVDKVTPNTGDDKKSKPEEDPSQVVSESGTVRGIKGRVREQIAASNQTQMMMHGFMKKQKSFTRTPLAVVHKSESDDHPIQSKRASLIRTGSQEDLSTQEPKQVFKRSNSQRVRTINQDENPEEKKLKPRGRAPPPPQTKQKQLQGVEATKTTTTPPVNEAPSIQTTEQPPLNNVTTPATQLDTGPVRERAATGGPENVRKVPPKVKPKMTRAKSKEAEDKVVSSTAPVTTADTVTTSVKSYPAHPATLSKRAKSESHLKSVAKQLSPNKKSSASIQSSNDGRQVLVLCPSPPPGGNKQDQFTSAVRIFLPPPPPMLPPCEEQEDNTEPTKSPEKGNTVTSAVQDKQIVNQVGTDGHVASQSSDTSAHTTRKASNVQDNTPQAIEPFPRVVFDPTEDLPPTPPGTPHNELVSGTTELPNTDKEIVTPDIVEETMVPANDEETTVPANDEETTVPANDEETIVPTTDEDIETVPLPPPMDDFSIDEDSLPPPVDFDPSLLPPPLPGDDEFDETFIVPPPPSAEDDDTVPTLPDMVPSFEDVEEDTLVPDDVPPESTPPWTPPINSEEPVEFEGDIDIPSIPDSLPAEKDDALEETQNIRTTEIITETDGDVQPPVEGTEELDAQDELSNIISSLQTMLQDQAESGEEVDDSLIQTPPLSAWKQPPESPPKESLPDNSKNELMNQDVIITHSAIATQDAAVTTVTKQDAVVSKEAVVTQDAIATQDTVTTVNKQDTDVAQNAIDTVTKPDIDQSNMEIASAEAVKQEIVTPKTVPTPVRVAPPPPPLPPISKSISKLPTSPTKAKSPPPSVKPKPKRPMSQSSVEEFQDELAAKLKKRQTKEQGWEGNTPQTAPTTGATQPQPKRIISRSSLPSVQPITPASQSTVRTAQKIMQPSQSSIQPTAVPPFQEGVMPTQNIMGAGNAQDSQEQQEQIKMLQNQIQILQLQQQLQQLQQGTPGQDPNPMMSLPQLGVPGMQVPAQMGMQMPQIPTGMQVPGTGIQLAGTSLPAQMMSPSVGTSTPPIPNNVTSTPTSTVNTSADSDTRSESPPPLPLTSPPPLPTTSPPPLTDPNSSFDQLANKTMHRAASDSVLHQRPPSQVLRSRAAGQFEDALDDILEEVRETDHNTILKKPLPPPEQTMSPHTEMASLLAQAMKQRRINITSKRHSTSMDDEQDTSHEWD